LPGYGNFENDLERYKSPFEYEDLGDGSSDLDVASDSMDS
jgi:hypothetical protein